MAISQLLRNLLLGKDRIDSRSEYKEAMLRGQFGLLIGGICFSYIFIDLLNEVTAFLPFYLIGMVVSVLIVVMNRNKKSKSASITILVFSNIVVYIFASIDSPLSGVFLFFTANASAAVILFARRDRYIGFIFAAISLVLGISAYLIDWSPISSLTNPNRYEQTSFIINYIIGMLSCIMIILFAINRNNESESSLMSNIKAREEAEISLMQKNEELEKANKELDRFVYSASHDMRAPLSSLLGLMEIVRLSNKDNELTEYFGLMKTRILTMEAFIKEITDYSRNSRMEVTLEVVNLTDLVNEVITSVEFLSPKIHFERKVNIPDNFMIRCDVTRTKVILSNLIANCIKYYNGSKAVNWYSILAKEDESHYSIEIADNGIGIAEKYQPKIFDMFFRGTESSDGSGLGLYIVKETIQKLRGTISCTSTLGEGSTFTIGLPKAGW